MTSHHPNIERIQVVAAHLGELCQEVVFVGGAATNLLITDSGAATVRVTDDVDVAVEVSSRKAYRDLERALRARGFHQDESEGAPICRWVIEGIRVDVMPTSPAILGFGNVWFPAAVDTAQQFSLGEGLSIRLITAPLFLATKLEAFKGRGEGDFLASTDIQDVIALVDGRPELPHEVQVSDVSLRRSLASSFSELLALRAFRESIPGHLPPDAANQRRVPIVLERLGAIRAMP